MKTRKRRCPDEHPQGSKNLEAISLGKLSSALRR